MAERIYWSDGRMASANAVVIMDKDINLNPIIGRGRLRDGRPVELIKGKWIIKEG